MVYCPGNSKIGGNNPTGYTNSIGKLGTRTLLGSGAGQREFPYDHDAEQRRSRCGNRHLTRQAAIHRVDPPQINAFIGQGGKDLSWGLIDKAGHAQMGKHLNPFTFQLGPH